MNPIKEKHLTHSWPEMAQITGLHEQTLINISKMTPDKLLGINLGTASKLKKELNINILKYIYDYDKEKTIITKRQSSDQKKR